MNRTLVTVDIDNPRAVSDLLTLVAKRGRLSVFDFRTGQHVLAANATPNGSVVQVNVFEDCQVLAEMAAKHNTHRLVKKRAPRKARS